MLVVIIIAACGALAFVGVSVCRLAARSDSADTFALAEWIATSQLMPEPIRASDGGRRQREEPSDLRYRATG
ncbi:MAG TPA: hypothetical protein VGN13_06410 [Solirubrobacteraceae bacterium]